ncbi:MAG: BamA/TamA family outer membrane protein, partial [bacterium]|nr:BamA/TamA family outer membrane protein [bacterium]
FAECQFGDSLLNLTFVLKANPHFSSVQFKNNTVFSDSLLTAQISSVPGVPIHHPTSKKDVARILRLYQQAGYSIMNVDKIDFRSDTLTIFINEGIVSDIQVDGNIRTREFVIKREFSLKKGDIFNMNLVDQGVNDIYSSNLFKTVSIDLAQQKDKSAKLTIRVEEKAFNVLRMSLRHDLERKNKALIEVIDENFIGMANPLSLQAQYGLKDRLFKFKYRSDRILNTYLTMTLEIYHHQLRNFVYENGAKFGEYQLRDNGISLSFGRQIERLGVLSLIASIDDIYLKPISGSGYPTGRYDLKTLSLQSIVDTQDQFPFPTSGKYYLFLYKLSSASIFNSQTSFFKLYSSLELYQTFFNRNTIHPKLLWGTSDLSTPFFEFFELGGQNSFFGLNDKELLGRHLVCGSLEYRYRFPFGFAFDFYFSIRYDVGATWKNYVEITPRDFFQGIGTSLAMNTPAGPISVSIGRMNRGKTVLYFSAGFDF